MKNILLLLFLLLPIASFAEETADDMTTIFEEHFDGWLYLHETGMNATYDFKPSDISMQTYEAYHIPPNKLPCLRFAMQSRAKIIISNFTGASGKFILSYKSYNASFSVTYATDKDKAIKIKSKEGYNIVKIHDKGVEIIEASCPDKVCIHQGFITKSSESIVCLPNKVHIKITTEDNHESEEDVISK